MTSALLSALSVSLQNPSKTLGIPYQETPLFNFKHSFKNNKLPFRRSLLSSKRNIALERLRSVSSKNQSAIPLGKTNYEFHDAGDEVELRLDIETIGIESPSDIFVDADDTSLLVRVKASGTLITLMEISRLFEKIKSSETIWYIDEGQLVVNLKKCYKELKWPDIAESWESLTSGVIQLLKGTSIYLIGDSTEINQKVSADLALGLGYTPLSTSDLLESYAQQSIASWLISEGEDSVSEAEASALEGLSSHVRTVVATLGGQYGAARKHDKWRHLHAGFTVWLSKSEAADEASAKEEARRHIQDGNLAYSNADVVVKLSGWDMDSSQVVAQACLSALKQLILSDKQLTGKKSLYLRLGCRGDWPNIKPPGWDPASKMDPSLEA